MTKISQIAGGQNPSPALADKLEIENAGGTSYYETVTQLLALIEANIGTAAFRTLIDDADAPTMLATLGAIAASLMTARGDIIIRDASAPARLAVGAANRVLKSDGTDPAWGQVTEAMQLLADNTTADVSTSAHGYAPKAPNDTTKFLRGDASWAVPSGGSETNNSVGILAVNTTAVGNVGTGEDDLITYSVAGSTLANNGEYLHFTATGQLAASINNKRIKVIFGSTTIFDTGTLAITSATDWSLEGEIVRVDATNQRANVRFVSSSTTIAGSSQYAAPTETLSGALTLKLTGTGTSNDDIVQRSLVVEKFASNGIGIAVNQYVCIWDQKSSGSSTPGGTFTSGAWRTRDLNTENADTGNNASVASNQITLAAGTYWCYIRCPAYQVAQHQARLYNITNTAVILMGSSAYSGTTNPTENDSVIQGRFTLSAQTVLEVQHRCNTTRSSDGFGTSSAFSVGGDYEVFTVAEFWKEATGGVSDGDKGDITVSSSGTVWTVDTVVARYTRTTTQSISNNTVTIVDYATSVRDTDSAVTTGAAWHFTCPTGEGGDYFVSAAAMFDAASGWAIGEVGGLKLYKNGSSYSDLDRKDTQSGTNTYMQLSGSDSVNLAAGDTIDVRVIQTSGGSINLIGDGSYNHIAIHKIH